MVNVTNHVCYGPASYESFVNWLTLNGYKQEITISRHTYMRVVASKDWRNEQFEIMPISEGLPF